MAWPKPREVIDYANVDGVGPNLDSFDLELHEVKIFGNVAILQYSARYNYGEFRGQKNL